VILPPQTWPAWLGEEPTEPDALKSLLKRDDGVAGEYAGREREEQRRQLDRAGGVAPLQRQCS
jgi:hypothetical protein